MDKMFFSSMRTGSRTSWKFNVILNHSRDDESESLFPGNLRFNVSHMIKKEAHPQHSKLPELSDSLILLDDDYDNNDCKDFYRNSLKMKAIYIFVFLFFKHHQFSKYNNINTQFLFPFALSSNFWCNFFPIPF